MDNTKDNQFYIQKMIKDLSFIIEKTENLTQDEIEKDEVLVDSIMFRLIQVAENSGKLTDDFKKQHSSFQWKDVKGMRNNIVHDYGNIDLKIVYDTIKDDIPLMLEMLKEIEL